MKQCTMLNIELTILVYTKNMEIFAVSSWVISSSINL